MSMRQRIVATAVGAVVLVVAFFVVALSPKLGQISKTHNDLAQAQQQEQQLRAQIAQLQQIRKNAPITIAKLATLAAYLPSSPDLPGFIRQLQDAAAAAGVDLKSIAPTAPQTLQGSVGVQTISVTINVVGGFFEIEDLLRNIEDLARAVEISALSVSPQVDTVTGATTLSSTMTMQMFVVQPNATYAGGSTIPAPAPSASASASPSPSAGAS